MKKKLSIVIREKDRERKMERKRERERVVKRFLDLKVESRALEKMFSG